MNTIRYYFYRDPFKNKTIQFCSYSQHFVMHLFSFGNTFHQNMQQKNTGSEKLPVNKIVRFRARMSARPTIECVISTKMWAFSPMGLA